MELVCGVYRRPKSRAILLAALLSLSVSGWAQINPCDLNRDGVIDSADVALAVNMVLGKASCTANIEGPATCTILTVQRVSNASHGRACVVSNTPSITSAASAKGPARTDSSNSASSGTTSPWSNGYLYRTTAVVASGQITGTLTNWPALVSLFSPNLATAANGGAVQNTVTQTVGSNSLTVPADFLVTADAAGQVPISGVEFEAYSASAGTAQIWVNLASAAVGSTIYIWYGNAGVTTLQGTPSAAWNSSYGGVWHMSEGSGSSVNDSTTNRQNGTWNGTPSGTSGYYSPGLISPWAGYFDGSTDYANFGATPNVNFGSAPFSISLWLKTTQTGYGRLITKRASSDSTWYSMLINYPENSVELETSGPPPQGDSVQINNGNTHDIVAVKNGTIITYYVDGASAGTDSAVSDITTTGALYAGVLSWAGQYFQGLLGEFRLSSAPLTAAWIAADHNNQSAPNTFWSITYNAVSPPAITSATSASGAVGTGFSYQITATNTPTSYSATGLPVGLSVSTSTGLISGTPSSAGTSTVALGATNASGTGYANITLTIGAAPAITSATSDGGTVGTAFAYQIVATNSPTSYSATGLPAGLSVSTTTGRISGTPTAAGTSTVTLGATNGFGTGHATLTLTIAVTAWGNGYLYRTTAVVASGQITGTLTNWPGLVSLSSPNLATVANGGSVQNTVTQTVGSNSLTVPADFLVTSDAAGQVPISGVEFEAYSASAGTAQIWVNLASAAVGSTIYIWYGNASVTTLQGTPSAAWKSSYGGVWHMSEGSGSSVNDSTTNRQNGTWNGTPSGTSGYYSPGLISPWAGYFDGSTDYANFGATPNVNFGSAPFSISLWLKTTQTGYGRLITKRASSDSTWYSMLINYPENSVELETSGPPPQGDSVQINNGNTHDIVAVKNGTIITYYVDGASAGTDSAVSDITTTGALYAGVLNWAGQFAGQYFQGLLGEFRLSSAPLTAAWIAADHNNQSAPSTFWSITYNQLSTAISPPAITSATSASGTVGTAFSYQITATNTPTSYSATGLPAGLSVSATTGLISGTPSSAGTSTITLGATNSGGTGNATLTLTIAVPAPAITSATSASGTVGTAFSYQIVATNTPTSYGATGLPAGLLVSTTNGLISGTPTASGTSTVTLGATNAGGTGNATLTLTITVAPPAITSATSASGSVGTAFSYQIVATNTPTSYSATGLPTGLSVSTTTGLISGTPTAAGTSTVTLGATNAGGTGHATLTLTITVQAPVITSATSANGTVGTAFSYQIVATNTPTSYTATGLLGGLSVSTTTGLISGTPTSAGTSTVTLGATNAGGTGNATLTLTITVAPPAITSATSASGSVGTAFSYQITATNSPTSYSATGLPTGLSVSSTTGLISGTPTAAGTSTVTLGATNAGGTGHATLTLTITVPAPAITSATSAGGTVGTSFSYQIVATNAPTSYSATGLPAGLSVSTTTGLISGTPSAAGTSTVTLGATNATGTGHANLTLTITVAAPVITSATSAGGTVGTAFSYQIVATNAPTSYSATGLPAGLSVSTTTGLISGTPTSAGTSTVTLGATNAGGTGHANLTLTITVAAPVITSATSAGGTVGTAFSYQIVATNTPTSYSATGLPAGLSVSTTTGLISGTPTASGTSTVTLGATNAGGTGYATLTLTVAAAGAHSVTLTWTASTSPNIAGYNIYRGTTSLSGPYPTLVNSGLITTTTYVDTSVVGGQTYYYAATAVNTSGVASGDSTPATAVVP